MASQLERVSGPPALRWWACQGGNFVLHRPLWPHDLRVHSHLPPARLQASSLTDSGNAMSSPLLTALMAQRV